MLMLSLLVGVVLGLAIIAGAVLLGEVVAPQITANRIRREVGLAPKPVRIRR
jgi:hypothetical protein